MSTICSTFAGSIICILTASSMAHPQSLEQAEARIADATYSENEIDVVSEPFRLNFGAVQDPPASAPFEPVEDDWRVDVTAYLWVTAMDGDVGVGPLSHEVDASFIDILQASDSFIGFAGRLEIGKGRWGAFIDGMFSKMGVEDLSGPVGLGDIDLASKMALIDFGAIFRVCEKPATNGGGRPHAFDVFAGGRYQSIEIELDPALAASRSQSQSWLDPIVGGRGILQISERFDFVLVGDIGGFGVGSDLTWSVRALLGYHFIMFDTPATAFFGYAALGTDYTDGSGPRRFEWDIVTHGPVVGLSLRF